MTLTSIRFGDVYQTSDGLLIALTDSDAHGAVQTALYEIPATRVELHHNRTQTVPADATPATPQQRRHALFAYYAALRETMPQRRAADRRQCADAIAPLLADYITSEHLTLADMIVAEDGCTGHRERCRFGRDHSWCIGHYDRSDVNVWHTSMICPNCSGVCDAELMLDGEVCACGTHTPHRVGPSPFTNC